jgi:hypothetical protein
MPKRRDEHVLKQGNFLAREKNSRFAEARYLSSLSFYFNWLSS